MHSVSPNYTMPTIMSSLAPSVSNGTQKPANARASAASTGSTSSSTSSSSGAGGLSTTFLTLLAQELQNQDPTAPVDPTAMVGQMISLNQLEQLISINQTLTTPAAAASGAAQAAAGSAASLTPAASLLSPSAAGAATNQLPFDPNTMMPLGSSNAAAAEASINSYMNLGTSGNSATNSNASGGK